MNITNKLYDKTVRTKISALMAGTNVAPMITGFINIPSFDTTNVINAMDGEGNIWFISTTDALETKNVTAFGRTNLLFNDTSSEEMNIISVYGEASVNTSIPFSDFKSNKKLKTWLKETKNLNHVAIKLVPDEACFWDNAKNSYTTLFKLEHLGVIALDNDNETRIAMSA